MCLVKQFANKSLVFGAYFMISVGFMGAGASVAHAEDVNSKAILNSVQLTELLHGVAPERLQFMVDRIAKGEVPLTAPNQPVWVMNSISGDILYYQGQASFRGKPASYLVDDVGFRFGQKSIQDAKNHKFGWINLNLGGTSYRAYCKAQYPVVVCTLAV